MIAIDALHGAMEVLGNDAYAAGLESDRSVAAARFAAQAERAWWRELSFFAAAGEVVIEGDRAMIRQAIEEHAAAHRAWGAAAARHSAGVASSAELDQAEETAAAAERRIEYRVWDAVTAGADPPAWPRHGSGDSGPVSSVWRTERTERTLRVWIPPSTATMSSP